jgi:hypothetical protein
MRQHTTQTVKVVIIDRTIIESSCWDHNGVFPHFTIPQSSEGNQEAMKTAQGYRELCLKKWQCLKLLKTDLRKEIL